MLLGRGLADLVIVWGGVTLGVCLLVAGLWLAPELEPQQASREDELE